MNPNLLVTALRELPQIVGFFQGLFHHAHPGEPTPTSEEVIAAFQQACASSLAQDAEWLAAHPQTP